MFLGVPSRTGASNGFRPVYWARYLGTCLPRKLIFDVLFTGSLKHALFRRFPHAPQKSSFFKLFKWAVFIYLLNVASAIPGHHRTLCVGWDHNRTITDDGGNLNDVDGCEE